MKEDDGGRRGPPSFAGRPQVYLAATNRKARVHDPTILAKEKVLAKGMERRCHPVYRCSGGRWRSNGGGGGGGGSSSSTSYREKERGLKRRWEEKRRGYSRQRLWWEGIAVGGGG